MGTANSEPYEVGHPVRTMGDSVKAALAGDQPPTRIAISSTDHVIIDELVTEMPDDSESIRHARELAGYRALQPAARMTRGSLIRALELRGDKINELAHVLGSVLDGRAMLNVRAADLGRAARAAHQAGEKARAQLEDLRAEVETCRTLIERERGVKEQLLTERSEAAAAHRLALETRDEQIEELLNAKHSLEREVRSLNDDKAAGREQNERLIESAGELRRKLKTAEAAADQLLTERGNRVDAQAEELTTARRQIAELQARAVEIRYRMRKDLAEMTEHRDSLNARIDEEIDERDAFEHDLTLAREEVEQVRGALRVAEGLLQERDAQLAECDRALHIAKVVDHVQDTGRDATIGGVNLTKRKGTVIGHATPEQVGGVSAVAMLRKLYGDRYVDDVLGGWGGVATINEGATRTAKIADMPHPAYRHVNAPCSVEPVLAEPPVSLKTQQRTVRNLRRARAQRRLLQAQLAELRTALLGLAEQK